MGIGEKDMTDTTQPELLRLADEFERPYWDDGTPHGQLVEAATELRRLHAELQRCKQVCDATAEGWRADAEGWKAEREALLGALKELTGGANKRFSGGKWDRARAAINAMEEKT